MKISVSLALIFLLFSVGHTAEKNRWMANVTVQARQMSAALLKEDYVSLAKFTHPKVVQWAGGKVKIIQKVRQGTKEQKAAGFAITALSIETPTGWAMMGKEIVAIIPEVLTMRVPDGTMKARSFLVGVSSDKGAHWTFVDGAALDDNSVRKLFPHFPKSLKLPKKQPAVVNRKK